jgi:Ca2+-binding RTX toxin-like protein
MPDSHPFHDNYVNGVIHSLENNPATVSKYILQTDIADGTLYLSANSAFNKVGVQTVNLNENFINDINTSNDFIRIGIISQDESTTRFNVAELQNIKLILTTELFCGKLLTSFDNVIYGTESDDDLMGTENKDLIFGYGGNDTINGGKRNDCIYGGDGNDIIFDGKANDTIYGGDGDDIIQTSGGSDKVYGGAGDDIIYEKSLGGSNIIDGGDGFDRCTISNDIIEAVFSNCEIIEGTE